MQAGNARPLDAVDLFEVAANQDSAVRLNGKGKDNAFLWAGTCIESIVHTPVGLESNNAGQAMQIEIAECPCRKNLLIGLNGDGVDRAVSAGAGIKRSVQRAFDIHARDAVAVGAGYLREEAT